MGRKKKETIEIEKEEQSPIVHGDAKRSAVAIFLFALAILFVLGFLSDAKIVDAGPLGKFLDSVAGWMFGVGKYISPIVLIMAGIILLFRKETLFYVSKIAGIFMAFASVLGLIHILAYEPDKMLAIAKAGEGGGFLGYILGIVFFKLVGTIGSSVILVALMLIGIIVAFNFSLVSLFQKFIKRKTEESEEENSDPEDEDEEETQGDPIIAVEKEQSVEEEEFVPDAEEEETESRMDHVLKKAAAWMPKGKEKEKEKKQLQTAMNWELPPVDLLEASIEKAQGGDVKKNAKIIQDTLRNFGIEVEPGEIKTGPTVTQYSFRPAVGVKLSRITTLSSDLALRLAARQVRIEAPIPGKSMVGIEVPNKTTATIRMPELLKLWNSKIENQICFWLLEKMSVEIIFLEI